MSVEGKKRRGIFKSGFRSTSIDVPYRIFKPVEITVRRGLR
jgi:hypothetical protein